MPHLLTLDGRPQTWAELKTRNDAYWDVRERAQEAIANPVSARMSARCSSRSSSQHSLCTGIRGRSRLRCECSCHRRAI